jgi:hypothetical protein
LLQDVLGVLIDELLVVGNDGLGDGLTDGVNLRSVSTTSNSDADVDAGEFVEANDQDGFVDLKSQDLGLDEVERLSVDLNKSLSCLFPICQSPSFMSSSFCIGVNRTLQWATAVAVQFLSALPLQSRSKVQHTSLLLAEALHTLCRGHGCDWRHEECFVELKSNEGVAGQI